MHRRTHWVGLVLAAICTACVGQAGASDPASEVPTHATLPLPAAATPAQSIAVVDEVVAVEPVSRSNPSDEAQAAMKLCGVDRIGIEHVTQMGEIASARDAARYVGLWGAEPELQTDAAAWLIVFSGKIDLGRGYWAQDPVCAVIAGTPTMFEPGPYGRGDTTEIPPTPETQPTEALPALAP